MKSPRSVEGSQKAGRSPRLFQGLAGATPYPGCCASMIPSEFWSANCCCGSTSIPVGLPSKRQGAVSLAHFCSIVFLPSGSPLLYQKPQEASILCRTVKCAKLSIIRSCSALETRVYKSPVQQEIAYEKGTSRKRKT